ncbi:MAG TPA: hypothetical protein VK081_05290 [Planctomycetota bacterium]|nr:hypothetical protein [Planctomycetota bacterium]
MVTTARSNGDWGQWFSGWPLGSFGAFGLPALDERLATLVVNSVEVPDSRLRGRLAAQMLDRLGGGDLAFAHQRHHR